MESFLKRPLMRPSNYPPDTPETISFENSFTKGNKPIRISFPTSPIYHYTSLDTALRIIGGHKLKFSNPNTFNDALDLHEGFVDVAATTQQKLSFMSRLNKGKTKSQRKNIKKAVLQNSSGFTEGMKSGLSASKDGFGVCCFSKSHQVALMWGHYAKGHSGVCLGFEFYPVEIRDDCTLMISEVEYKDEIKPINYFSERDSAVQQWFFTKKKEWEYEQEVRAFINNRNCICNYEGQDLFDFERACLKEIYFGSKVKKEDIDAVLNSLLTNKYNLSVKKKMVISGSSFIAVDL